MSDFIRTKIIINVLSDAPIPEDEELGSIIENCDTGDYVGASIERESEVLTGKEMADALVAAGSDPGFFMLNLDGERDES